MIYAAFMLAILVVLGTMGWAIASRFRCSF